MYTEKDPWMSTVDGRGRWMLSSRPSYPSVPVLTRTGGAVSVLPLDRRRFAVPSPSYVIPDGRDGWEHCVQGVHYFAHCRGCILVHIPECLKFEFSTLHRCHCFGVNKQPHIPRWRDQQKTLWKRWGKQRDGERADADTCKSLGCSPWKSAIKQWWNSWQLLMSRSSRPSEWRSKNQRPFHLSPFWDFIQLIFFESYRPPFL